jgi:nucleotide-binding universal stress UspA family protein
MPPFRSILFAADFSETSVDAFRVAGSLAVGDETRLIVLHVIDPDRAEGAPAGPGGEDLEATLRRQLREVYLPNRALRVEYQTTEGSPAARILQMAGETGSDLIVMGTHGRTGLRRLLAGSVAMAVLEKAPCAVLALRADRHHHQPGEIRVILHPTDFSKASDTALGVARDLARDLGARLIVLHVVPPLVDLEGTPATEIDLRDYQRSLDVLRRRLEGPDLKEPVETRLARGSGAEEILRVADESGCGLIVLGTHGHTGLARIVMGNVAESVLSRAECPVLVVKWSPEAAAQHAAEAEAAQGEAVP